MVAKRAGDIPSYTEMNVFSFLTEKESILKKLIFMSEQL
jgi:hypothetical protein